MGCEGSKDKKPDTLEDDGAPKPKNRAPAKAAAAKPKASSKANATEIANASRVKLCREIVSKMDSSGDGVMQQDELQILVKHLDPAFINVPTNQIQITDPKI